MQSVVFMMERPEVTWDISLKAGNMTLNKFCIHEDAAFELSEIINGSLEYKFNRKLKGKKCSLIGFYEFKNKNT